MPTLLVEIDQSLAQANLDLLQRVDIKGAEASVVVQIVNAFIKAELMDEALPDIPAK